MKRFIIILFFAVVAVFSLTVLSGRNTQTAQYKANEQNTNQIPRVPLIIGDEYTAATYSGVAAATAFTALERVASVSGIKLKTKQYDFGVLVQAIGEKQNSDLLSWIYFINGKSPIIASDRSNLKDGDTVEWKYVRPDL
ncbi:hypothetical protein A2154_00520 [Candidatus Gottesmanbacteria bacterium RBG_16_43_7]|uniref:Transcobalamin-like C-terminal domain-containing protein n=1 Tax=Candidatus Gottesmanbacteria bacterium RBG_16_43_7 TaxID=1798373 RepID=A0A1F5Z834_9BACT|nr:MAG: hypothetical protein A2154_00520 [Candidatus Gottesmanbacteria bacterium RBG_16_43_7]